MDIHVRIVENRYREALRTGASGLENIARAHPFWTATVEVNSEKRFIEKNILAAEPEMKLIHMSEDGTVYCSFNASTGLARAALKDWIPTVISATAIMRAPALMNKIGVISIRYANLESHEFAA